MDEPRKKLPSHLYIPPATAWEEPARDSWLAVHQMVQAEDLSAVFQPIVDLASGEMFAMEALVRCRIEEFADPPSLFRHAVAARCCGRLGRMIREIAVPLCPDTPLFVNIHPNELSDRWLVRPDDPISATAARCTEITESVPLTHYELCMDVLAEVRSRGNVHLVVDDLGSGLLQLEANCRSRAQGRQARPRAHHGARPAPAVAAARRERSPALLGVRRGGRRGRDRDGRRIRALCDTGTRYGQGFFFARPSFPVPAITWPPIPVVSVSPSPKEAAGSD